MLGILLNSVSWEMCLPGEKLDLLKILIEMWLQCSHCTKCKLLSLIGSLSTAAKVVPPGRTFVCRLLDLASVIQELYKCVPVTLDVHQDILWWHNFLPSWNGRSLFHKAKWTSTPDLELFTDASEISYGAVLAFHWFSGCWTEVQLRQPIVWRQLYPIILACMTWEKQWGQKRLLFHCDNQAVVDICQWHKQ